MRTMRLLLGATLAVTTGFAEESIKSAVALAPLIKHVEEHRDGKAPHSIDFAALEGGMSQLPIGVFDSGIGGLTVLEAVLGLDAFNNATLQPGADGVPDFAGEKFLYLGDQANMPYGNYPSKGREDYLRELIVKDAVFLLGRRYHASDGVRFDKPPVKAIVIACNTATAYGIEDIRAALKAWGLDVPVIGVVEAGARAVVEQLPSEGKAPTVGVIATVGTCSSNAYPKAIARAAGLAGKPVPQVVQQGSVGLAGAIEGNPAFVWNGAGERPVPYAGPKLAEPDFAALVLNESGLKNPERHVLGWERNEAAPQSAALNSVEAYTAFDVGKLVTQRDNSRVLRTAPLGMVVLGCTHFPLAEESIQGAFDNARSRVLAPGGVSLFGLLTEKRLRFINPAEHTAKELFRELARARLRNKAVTDKKAAPGAEYFLSVPNTSAPGVKLAIDGSLEADYRQGRDAGHPEREDTKVVRMTFKTLPVTSSALVKRLKLVCEQLEGARGTDRKP